MPEIIHTKIRGVDQNNEDGSTRQRIIKKYVDDFSTIYLEREPDNRYDKNAIAVMVMDEDGNDYQIGYLGRDLAAELGERENGINGIDCEVVQVTGGEEGKKTLGVNIKLIVWTPEELHEQHEKRKKAQEQKNRFELPEDEKPQIIKATKSFINNPNHQPVSNKSRMLSLILCIPFGWLGLHQFYAGRKVLGFVYMLTGGLVLFGWVIDLILILTGNFKDKNGNYIIKW